MSQPQLLGIEQTLSLLNSHDYIASEEIATAVYLATQLCKPLLIEGPPGVGKTELAKTLATAQGLPLIRLQCYEGLDEAKALYEWKYGKQLLYTQILKEKLDTVLEGASNLDQAMNRLKNIDDLFYSRDFLEPRPLLSALQQDNGCVLLIDEIDKSDEEFEALLLEILSDFQISLPEIGTIKATTKPIVLLTSNSSRELSDALKRRCLHLYIPFPSAEMEQQILQTKTPQISTELAAHMARFIAKLRQLELKKLPAVSETLDWAQALLLLHATSLEPRMVRSTLNLILKYQEDIDAVSEDLPQLLGD
ncbi:MAG: MoxR family ATPase [Pseudomonadales bacterium]